MNSFPPGFESDNDNLAIDFDGVIHDDNLGYHDGTCYGKPIEGAIEAIIRLSKKFKIIIFTAKVKPDRPLVNGKTGRELVWDWLDKYGLVKYIDDITSEKPRAFMYIDDKGYKFENWDDTLKVV